MNEIEAIYQKALYPIFQKQFRIIHNTDNTTNIILDGKKEEFYFTLYGNCCVYLYWCNECFIFDYYRNNLVSSDTYGEIVFEGNIDVEELPKIIIEIVLQLKDCLFLNKQEIVKGKIPSGYDDIKDYVIKAKTSKLSQKTYQLNNITIEYYETI